ncbi:MAG: DMT family transporter [candidate division WOR-3 bacterium]
MSGSSFLTYAFGMWVGLSLACALSWATSDLFSKRAMARGEADEATAVWAKYLIALPFAIPLLLLGIPHLSARFFLLQVIAFPLEILALLLYMRAIRLSPLSLTLPFLSLTPAFLLLIGFVALRETPSLLAGFGVILITFGGYLLSAETWVPLSAIRKEKGPWLMIAVSFIYAITAALGKMLIAESSPTFFPAYYLGVMTVLFTPIAFLRRGRTLKFSVNLVFAGIFHAGMVVSHMAAIVLTKAAYMIALKRLAGVFGVIYGRFFFGEKRLLRRLIAAGIMFLGAFMVSLG